MVKETKKENKTKVLLIAYIVLILIVSSTTKAHSNILYDIDLSFDQSLYKKVVESAQSYLDTAERPIQFDFDRELIVVKFNRTLEYSVSINPADYSLNGFRDDNLITVGEKVNLNEKERKEIAQKVFDKLDKRYKSELVYGGEKKLYSGVFKHSWYRHVNRIYVSGEHLEVEVDGTNGNIIAWRLSIFSYPKTNIKIAPAITYQVAQKIAEIKFNAIPLDFKPILIIDGNRPVWVLKVKGIYPFFVGVDASEGNVLYSGSLRADLPEDYDYGREVEVVQTEFIKGVYGG